MLAPICVFYWTAAINALQHAAAAEPEALDGNFNFSRGDGRWKTQLRTKG